MKKLIGTLYLKIIGWKVEGKMPENLDKAVMVAAPHTSNHDFPIALSTFWALGLPVHFLIKKSWMFFPMGIFMKWAGAVAVDRGIRNKRYLIDHTVDILKNEKEQMYILITPEGTRKFVKKWKTGFHRIAVEAGVPVITGYINYDKKVAGIGEAYKMTGDLTTDMAKLEGFYERYGKAKFPEFFNKKFC